MRSILWFFNIKLNKKLLPYTYDIFYEFHKKITCAGCREVDEQFSLVRVAVLPRGADNDFDLIGAVEVKSRSISN